MRPVALNAATNGFGWLAQALLGLASVPILIHEMGAESFGIYAVLLSVIGYFSIAQGLNLALVRFLSKELAAGANESAADSVVAAVQIALAGSLVVAGVLVAASRVLVVSVLNTPLEYQEAAVVSIRLAAVGFPSTALGIVISAVPQAKGRYDLTNGIVIASGVVGAVSSIVIVKVTGSLVAVILGHVMVSLATFAANVLVANALMPGLQLRFTGHATARREIAEFGSSSFGASVLSTIVYHLDRLVIAVVSGPLAVAAYAAAQLPVSRVGTLLSKVTEVLVPEVSRLSAVGDQAILETMYLRASRAVMVLATIIYLPIALLAKQLLSVWVGVDLAEDAHVIMSVLCLGLWVRALSAVPSAVNLGIGRASTNLRYSFASFSISAALMYPVVLAVGAEGAALVATAASLPVPLLIRGVNAQILSSGGRRYRSDVLNAVLAVAFTQALILLLGRSAANGPLQVAGLAGVSVFCALGMAEHLGVFKLPFRRAL